MTAAATAAAAVVVARVTPRGRVASGLKSLDVLGEFKLTVRDAANEKVRVQLAHTYGLCVALRVCVRACALWRAFVMELGAPQRH